MKWVIELDEDFVKRFINAGNEDDNFCYYGYNSPVGRALKNAKSFEEELEKIKEEIGEEFVDLQDGSEEWRSYVNDAVLSCYEILEKHIKENKRGVLKQIAEKQKTLMDSTKVWNDYIEKHGDIY